MSKVKLADRYEVNLGMPFPDFDTYGAEAFAATDIKESGRTVYALLQKKGFPIRQRVYERLHIKKNPHLCAPHLAQALTLPDGSQRLTTIADFPVGGRVFPLGKSDKPMIEQQIRERILPPLLAALDNLHIHNLAHRGVCMENIIYMDRAGNELGLLECITAPPAIGHHSCYEPLNRSRADGFGRGDGTPACDMFALGVVLLAVYQGPAFRAAHVPEEELHEERVQSGSFWAYTGGADIPGAMGTLIRGLLKDDAQLRWTLDDVTRWLEGGPIKGQGKYRRIGLCRSLRFKGANYKDGGVMADIFFATPDKGLEAIKAPDFRTNLIKIMGQDNDSEDFDKLLPPAEPRSGDDKATALATLSALIDPEGPIRFKTIKIMPDGLHWAIAIACAKEDRDLMGLLANLFSQRRLKNIIEVLARQIELPSGLENHAFKLSGVAEHTRLGGGLERILYTFFPSLTCQSPKIAGQHVTTMPQLLRAMELAAKNGSSTVDTHIAAFCATHDNNCEPMLDKLQKSSSEQRSARLLELFSYMQQKYMPEPLPALSNSLVASLREICSKFHSKTRRELYLKKLDKLANTGDLSKLTTGVDLQAERRADEAGFSQAKADYKALSKNIKQMDFEVTAEGRQARTMGYRGALLIAVLILGLTTSSLFFGTLLQVTL